MSKKRNKDRVNVVYSTNPNFSYQHNEEEEEETIAPNQQLLYVSLDKKQRAGKAVTLIEGFVGNDEDRKDLSKKMKNTCGVGGSIKEKDILIQGDQRTKIIAALEAAGYKVKRKGG